ncbi:MAG: translocation/assembly module TamB domain-containing protein [Fulvivirga sp.]
MVKILKITGWILLSIILLLIILIFSLRIPAVQDFITKEAVKFFKNKTATEADIGRLYVNFPKTIAIEDLYMEDLKGDTLAYCQFIGIDTDLWGLLNNRFEINNLEVRSLTGNIYNSETDSTFNYQFIIEAFSGEPKDTLAAQGEPFDFSIAGADITNSRVRYHDMYQGIKLSAAIGHFSTAISEFDLATMIITIDQVILKDSQGKFTILKEIASTDTTSSTPIDISGRTLFVDNVKFTFEDMPGKMKVMTDIGRVEANMEAMDLNTQRYQADDILIANSFVSIDQFTTEDTVNAGSDTIPVPEDDMKMLATANRAVIRNLAFRYYDHNYASANEGFDPAHLWLQRINADIEEVRFEDGYALGDINHLAAIEKGGMVLKELKTSFKYGKQESYGRNLSLITANSNIKGDLSVIYPSIDSLSSAMDELFVDADISRSTLDLEDLFYFQPALRAQIPYLSPQSRQLTFEGYIEGALADLTIVQVRLDALQATHLQVAGTVKGLPDMDQAFWDLKLKTLATTAKDINSILPDTLLPPAINLPPEISLNGTYNGTMADFKAEFNMKSTYGDLQAALKMKEQRKALYTYEGRVAIDALDLGKLLNKEAQMGQLSLQMEVDGAGFTPEDINTKVKGKISSAIYNGYNYQNLSINGHLFSKQFSGSLSMNDPNIDFDFEGLIDINDAVPQYSFTLDLKALDLDTLNFANEPLELRAKVMSDITIPSIQNINGTLEIKDFVITKGNDVYQVDTFLLSSVTDKDITDITIYSKVLDAQFKGNFNLETLPSVLKQHFNRYYSFADIPDVDALEPQQFGFNINIKRPLFFSEMLIPGLEELEPGPIEGYYDSEEWSLDIDIAIPKIVYDGITVDSLTFDLHSDEDYLGFETRLTNLASGTLGVNNISLSGLVEADHIETDLMIKDSLGVDKYHFGGIFISGPDYYRFQFTPGEFVLNYDPWNVKPSNSIDIHPFAIWINNMFLVKEDQQIRIESSIDQKGDSVLTAAIENFDLSLLGNPDESKKHLIAGILNGALKVSMESSEFAFTSDLDINQFSFKGDTLGNVMLQAGNAGGKVYNVALDIKSKTNNVNIDGSYLADSIPVMDLHADLVRLDLSTIEAFTMGQLQDLEGWLTGDLKITGTQDDPEILGRVNFNQTAFNVAYLQSKLRINNENIAFTNAGILFDDFIILDENDHTARIDGRILTKDYSQFELDLNFATDEFMLLNTTKDDNKLFYGSLEVSSTARITGTVLQPDIQLDVSLQDESNLTYIIPEEEIQIQEREGVVEFYDKDIEKDPLLVEEQQSRLSDTLTAGLTGVNLSAKIDINRNSTFSIIIDPVTGDQLTVQGDANLTLDIKPSGDMTLTGRYEVYDGKYNLNLYGLVKREFEISEGSYLIWTGDPLNARLDITATYAVSAVYEVPGQVEISEQRAPFLVYLDIKNELLEPDIAFRLGLQEGAAAAGAQAFVSNVNKDVNEVNAQVFYLLLFKATKNLESFSTSGGGGNIAEATARSSASRLLSNQLNQLAGRIEGVELSLDLQSYNTSDAPGGNTQLELGLSKQLFNDRVVVKIAGNFGLEGEQAERQENFSDFAGDIRIEYKLTKDGRYRLVGFRENEYDNLLQGEIIKTGAGIIFVRDYDALKELFNKGEEEEKKDKNK